MGYKVLIVDFDPQGNATSGLGVDKNSLGSTISDVISGSVALKDVILETEFHKLKLAPSTPILANTEIELANVGRAFFLGYEKL